MIIREFFFLCRYYFFLFIFSVNPIIYAYSSREFRRAFIKYLCRCFPIRIRNLMMSYHNLHLLRYRRAPESNMSKENIDSGSDNHNHNNNNNNLMKHSLISSFNIINPKPTSSKSVKQNQTRIPSRLSSLTRCCRPKPVEQQQKTNEKHSSVAVSPRTTAPTNVLVDYCTYHDVAVARVTCL